MKPKTKKVVLVGGYRLMFRRRSIEGLAVVGSWVLWSEHERLADARSEMDGQDDEYEWGIFRLKAMQVRS